VDWYYKAAIVVALLWGTGRALGVYGESARDLDLNFLTGFLLTLGGWAAVFYVIDRTAKFLGWRRQPATVEGSTPAPSDPETDPGTDAGATAESRAATPAPRPRTTPAPRRTGRRRR